MNVLHMPDERFDVLMDVAEERSRQEAKHGTNTAAHPDSMTDGFRLAILTEEVGETANALIEWDNRDEPLPLEGEEALRSELVQVAAVAVAWVEAIDARTTRRRPSDG
jgi:hypothetical protein